MPISKGLVIGFPVNSSPAPNNIGNKMQRRFIVASVLLLIKFVYQPQDHNLL